MDNIFEPVKYRSKGTVIAETLCQRIRSGFYPPGGRLPSCRQLAEEFSISKMTAATVLRKLAEKGIVCSRGVHGIFVPEAADEPLAIKKIIMCIPDWDGVFIPQFNTLGKSILRRRWNTAVEVIDLPTEAEKLRREMADTGNFFLFFHYPASLYMNFDKIFPLPNIKRRCAVFSVRSENFGISCFTGDELEIMRMSFAHLQSHGCVNIAMTHTGTNNLEADRHAALRRQYPQDWRNRLLDFSDVNGNDAIICRWNEIIKSGTLDQFDGIICTDPLMAFICRKVLLQHHRDWSKLRLLSIGSTFFLRPGDHNIDAVDSNLAGHFEALSDLIAERERGENFEPSFYLCEPHIISADSTVL